MDREKRDAELMLRVRRNKKRGKEWRTRVAKGKTNKKSTEKNDLDLLLRVRWD